MDHTATLLPNGQGAGRGGFGNGGSLYQRGIVRSGQRDVDDYQRRMNIRTRSHTATLLPNGKVLVAGGIRLQRYFRSSAEFYDYANGTWTNTGAMNTARITEHTATLLPNGQVLVAGGYAAVALSSAELYNLANGTWTVTGSLNTARYCSYGNLAAQWEGAGRRGL